MPQLMVKQLKVALVVIACLAIGATTASADVTRACEGSLIVSVGPPASGLGTGADDEIATLRGVGACANSAWANRCRERARDFIDECRQALWANRFTHPLPSACSSLVGTRTGARLKYHRTFSYSKPDAVFFRVLNSACCRLRPNDSSVTAKVHGVIWGGKKCGAKQEGFPRDYVTRYVMAPTVGIDCNHWRQQGICG
jgi:hypothetical protein